MSRVSPKSVMSGVSSQECLPKRVFQSVTPRSQECHVRSDLPRVSSQECLSKRVSQESPKSVPQECLPKSVPKRVFPRGSFQECHAKSVTQECLPGVSSQEDVSKSVMSVSQECHVRTKSVSQKCLPKNVFPRVSCQEWYHSYPATRSTINQCTLQIQLVSVKQSKSTSTKSSGWKG